jgi:hypothetical protein
MPILGISLADVKTYGRHSLAIDAAHFAGGYVAACIIRNLAQRILKKENDYRKHLATAAASIGGLIASRWLLSRLDSRSILDEKFVKLFALQALFSFATAWFSQKSECLFLVLFGISGYFGNRTLFYYEAAGAVLGAVKVFYVPSKDEIR